MFFRQAIAHLIDDCMLSDPADRPSAAQVFHRIAKTADATQIIKPLASRSAASSFESGRLGTASDPSVRSVLGVDAANQLTAQATSTDADSDADLRAHDTDLPAEELDRPPEPSARYASQARASDGSDLRAASVADQPAAEAMDSTDLHAHHADPPAREPDLPEHPDEQPPHGVQPPPTTGPVGVMAEQNEGGQEPM